MIKRTGLAIRIQVGAVRSDIAVPLSFYEWTTSQVLNRKVAYSEQSPVVLLSNEVVLTKPYEIYALLYAEMSPPLEQETRVLLVDASDSGGVLSAGLVMHLTSAIQQVLANYPEAICILLLKGMLPIEDYARQKNLEYHLKERRVYIVDVEGAIYPPIDPNRKTSWHDFQRRRAESRRHPRDLVEYKMVRRIGHFRIRHGCSRHYYDGSKCVDELAACIKEYANSCNVCTIGPVPQWLEDAVALQPRAVNESETVFVTDHVASGRTLRESFESQFPSGVSGAARVLSVTMAAQAPKSLSIGSKQNISVEALCVSSAEVYVDGACPMCRDGIPFSNHEREDRLGLCPYNFWALADEAGYQQEQDIPTYREGLPWVPRWHKVFTKHGPWLATKVGGLLRSRMSHLTDLLILCPEEEGPQNFMLAIQMLLGSSVVEIPRSVISEVQDGSDAFIGQEVHWQEQAWYRLLRESSSTHAAVMDEFSVSGKTLSALAQIAEYFGKEVSCAVPIFQYGHWRRSEVRALSLYRLPYPDCTNDNLDEPQSLIDSPAWPDDCRVLADLIRHETRPHVQRLMLADLLWKTPDSHHPSPLGRVISVLENFVQEDVRPLLRHKKFAIMDTKLSADVLIVSIVTPEILALKRLFRVPLGAREHLNQNGVRLWRASIERPDAPPLSVLLTAITEPQQIPCAVVCTELLSKYDVELCILGGISAGIKGKTSIGDVVVAREVLAYEPQRLEPGGARIRPQPYSLTNAAKRNIGHFPTDRRIWKNRVATDIGLIPEDELPDGSRSFSPGYHLGVILSGDKLLADDSLEAMRETYHERTRGLDQESAGFAAACESMGVDWLVFRGVSDFGGSDKDSRDDRWQQVAAMAALSSAKLFLETDHRTKDELERECF